MTHLTESFMQWFEISWIFLYKSSGSVSRGLNVISGAEVIAAWIWFWLAVLQWTSMLEMVWTMCWIYSSRLNASLLSYFYKQVTKAILLVKHKQSSVPLLSASSCSVGNQGLDVLSPLRASEPKHTADALKRLNLYLRYGRDIFMLHRVCNFFDWLCGLTQTPIKNSFDMILVDTT